MPTPFAQQCWFLTGPTAGGKTGVGIELAGLLGAEIVSLDSMALYREMDIGTAKPTPDQRRAVPHHLIDVIGPDEEYSLAQYVDAASRCFEEIRGRGHEVLFVGGTPLYLKALLRGIFEGPPADWELRRKLQREADRHGPEILHRRLVEIDPVTAERLHPNDLRRIVRALEVHEKTGVPISRLQQQFEVGTEREDCRVLVLDWPREQLVDRIDRRVDAMLADGLVEEVERLQSEHGRLSKTARQALGYREVFDHLAGKTDLPATAELIKQHTRQFAKRQGTWFRSLSECRFVSVSEPMDSVAVARQIARLGKLA